jgi:hypothetical protein
LCADFNLSGNFSDRFDGIHDQVGPHTLQMIIAGKKYTASYYRG